MKSHGFDRMTRALVSGSSRRSFLRAAGGAIAAAVTGATGHGESSAAQNEDEQPFDFEGVGPNLEPIFVSLDPIPLGGNEYFLDGNTFTLDPDVAASIEETPYVPFLIEGDTYFINPSVAVADSPALAATPTPLPVSEAMCPIGGISRDVELFRGDPGVTVEFVAANQSPVGNLRWNVDLINRFADPGTLNSKRYCSGTLITEDLLLTAGHCFDQCPTRDCERPPEQCPRPCPASLSGLEVPKIDGTSNPIARAEIATSMHVDFNYQLDGTSFNFRVWESFPIIELVEDKLGGLDYAIVRLANSPGLKYGVGRISPRDASPDSTLCIIGHPAGNPKQVETGQVWRIEGPLVRYGDLSTDAGSSGSGILASPQGAIVGVHTNGGCDIERWETNHGVRIEALVRVSPILANLAANPTS